MPDTGSIYVSQGRMMKNFVSYASFMTFDNNVH